METFRTRLGNDNNRKETNFRNFRRPITFFFFRYTEDWFEAYNEEKQFT